mmetsp:Transcript_9198/g.28522  ORF Transcript_9198/g.28522 Transcript_9198/m.28522 type:complete len:318 (-) Transcript_9198:1053-2006(-)
MCTRVPFNDVGAGPPRRHSRCMVMMHDVRRPINRSAEVEGVTGVVHGPHQVRLHLLGAAVRRQLHVAEARVDRRQAEHAVRDGVLAHHRDLPERRQPADGQARAAGGEAQERTLVLRRERKQDLAQPRELARVAAVPVVAGDGMGKLGRGPERAATRRSDAGDEVAQPLGVQQQRRLGGGDVAEAGNERVERAFHGALDERMLDEREVLVQVVRRHGLVGAARSQLVRLTAGEDEGEREALDVFGDVLTAQVPRVQRLQRRERPRERRVDGAHLGVGGGGVALVQAEAAAQRVEDTRRQRHREDASVEQGAPARRTT